MYKNIIYTLLAGILINLVSCSDFLEQEPLDFSSPNKYYETVDDLEANLASIYRELASNNLYGFWYIYRLGIEGDEGFYARTSPAVGPQVNDFTSSDGDIDRAWRSCWVGIGYANALLENIDTNPEIEIEIRDRVRGEALFLRGYYYFLLVQYWGGVPIKTEPTKDANAVHLPRASAKEVYEQIIRDMEQAEEIVADIRSLNYGGRVNKSAVRGMLARVNLHMAGYPVKDTSRFAEARKWAKMVMDDQEANHKLIEDYSQVFINYAQDRYDVDESLWEIEFYGNASDAYTNWGGVGYVMGPRLINAELGYCSGSLQATYKLWESYEDGDERNAWNVTNFTYNNTTGAKTFLTDTSVAGIYKRYLGKYRREYETLLPKTERATPINYPVLRYSDVLLMFAEADNEVNNGPTPEAIEAVNQVRRRAWSTGIKSVEVVNGGTGYTSIVPPTVTIEGGGGSGAVATAIVGNDMTITGLKFEPDAVVGLKRGSGYTSAPTITISGMIGSGAELVATIFTEEDADIDNSLYSDYERFKQLIQDERLREFPSESLRKSDLIRWGIFLTEMYKIRDHILQYDASATWYKNFANISDKHLLWPIPSREMALNREMVQNPNW